ncbi:hypothetical protein NYR55_11590 [Sphingomonas sp. BGYR3]|uniref:hypothetical protein n=1 Tax=Sphingomonas sp. BGYR3 TaxID=2975483 RepID=UPI0021A6E50B|nr:hypothetical protein [Sphingomonas sp. BGYR3]MDG5489257.1 hypothetical protein [Sphingomonas sp. BGYR3]
MVGFGFGAWPPRPVSGGGGGGTPTPTPGGTSPARYSPMGTRFRLPTGTQTINASFLFQAYAHVFATGAWATNEAAFFWSTFANLTSVADHEAKVTGALRIERISVLISGTWVDATITAGDETIDPNTDGAGKWVRCAFATPLPANTVLSMRVATEFTRTGTCPGGPAAAPNEAQRGSSTSLASTLTTVSLNNSNAVHWRPCAMMGKGGDGRPALLALGDSIGAGADQYANAAVMSARAEFGYLGLGLDDASTSKRIPCFNFCVPGQNPENYGTPSRVALKLEILTKAMALNGGASPVDEIVVQHGTNSVNGTVTKAQLVGHLKNVYSTFRAVLGATMPVTQVEMIALPASTDGYATLANQTPTAPNTYPTGVRWQVNEAIGGPDGLGSPSAELRADGSIRGSFAPWRYGSADTAADRDLLPVQSFTTTVAAAYGGSGNITLTDAPLVGHYLAVGGAAFHYGVVTSVTGTGPYVVGIIWQGGQAAKAVGNPVRATAHGSGLHPGPFHHAIMAQAVIDWKISRGWV